MRDWLFVEDHARALEAVVTKGRVGESYNVGGRSERTNLQVVQTICDLLDRRKPRRSGASYRDLITFVADRPGHDRRYAIDPGKIEAELGWRAAGNLRDRDCEDDRLVSRERMVVAADPRQDLCRPASRRGLSDAFRRLDEERRCICS